MSTVFSSRHKDKLRELLDTPPSIRKIDLSIVSMNAVDDYNDANRLAIASGLKNALTLEGNRPPTPSMMIQVIRHSQTDYDALCATFTPHFDRDNFLWQTIYLRVMKLIVETYPELGEFVALEVNRRIPMNERIVVCYSDPLTKVRQDVVRGLTAEERESMSEAEIDSLIVYKILDECTDYYTFLNYFQNNPNDSAQTSEANLLSETVSVMSVAYPSLKNAIMRTLQPEQYQSQFSSSPSQDELNAKMTAPSKHPDTTLPKTHIKWKKEDVREVLKTQTESVEKLIAVEYPMTLVLNVLPYEDLERLAVVNQQRLRKASGAGKKKKPPESFLHRLVTEHVWSHQTNVKALFLLTRDLEPQAMWKARKMILSETYDLIADKYKVLKPRCISERDRKIADLGKMPKKIRVYERPDVSTLPAYGDFMLSLMDKYVPSMPTTTTIEGIQEYLELRMIALLAEKHYSLNYLLSRSDMLPLEQRAEPRRLAYEQVYGFLAEDYPQLRETIDVLRMEKGLLEPVS